MNFFKDKFITAFLAALILIQPLGFSEDQIVSINSGDVKFQGLFRGEPTKAPNGSHTKFDNVYVTDDTLRAVKGRDRVASAPADATYNGIAYYENAAGTTKKIIVKEASSVVSYEVDGTGRALLVASGLANEDIDFAQIGDTLYFSGITDGLYKWTGGGLASAISGVSAPSAVNFTASAAPGGLTSGEDAVVTATQNKTTGTGYISQTIGGTCQTCGSNVCVYSASPSSNASVACADLDSGMFNKTCATSSIYKYKITKYNSKWGIESEASTADNASLSGNNSISWTCGQIGAHDDDATCNDDGGSAPTYGFICAAGALTNITFSGAQTSSSGTLSSAPGDPFDTYRVYRTVAGGSDYFLLGEQSTGAYTDGKPDSSLGNPFDTTLDTIDPPKARYIAEYKGTIFLGQGSTISFSRIPVKVASSADTYWLATDNIDIGSRKPITGLHNTSDSLMVFTENSIKEMTGFGASTFRIKNAIEGIGAISDETIETDLNGDLIFFAGTSGVYKLRTFDQPQVDATGQSVENNRRVNLQRISSPALDSVFQGTDSQIDLDPATYSASHAYYDTDNDLYFLYIDQHCFIYDNKGAIWSHLPASKFNGGVFRKSSNAPGVGVLYDNYGFIYNNWTGYENGIHSGTVTGNPTSSGNTTLTDSTATFNTTGDGLKGLWVFLDNENGEWRQISSNTGTQLTVSSAWTTNPAVDDIYYIAYIIPDFQTKQYSFGKIPQKTNVNNIYVIHGKSDTTQTLYMDLLSYVDRSITAENAKSFDLVTNYVDKVGTKGYGFWHDWEFRTFIYNTSNTIDPPLNILGYGLAGDIIKEK